MTCVPGFCDKQDLENIGEVFGRVKSFYLQQFVSEHAMRKEFCQMTPLLPNFLCEMRQTCLQFADLCEIRGL